MRPHICSGQLVKLEPRGTRTPQVDDIVLAKVRGAEYLHFVRAVRGEQVLIGNAHGHENGWTTFDKVYGLVVQVED